MLWIIKLLSILKIQINKGMFILQAILTYQNHQNKFHISIKYNRWFYPETYEEPVEDDFEIIESDFEIFKIYKYVNGDEIELKDKEFRKIEKYIIENLEICQ